MDARRLIIFVLISVGLLFVWQKYISPPPEPTHTTFSESGTPNTQVNPQGATSGANKNDINQLNTTTSQNSGIQSNQTIVVNTDVIKATINTFGGDIRSLDILSHAKDRKDTEPYSLLSSSNNRIFIAQTGLLGDTSLALPTHTSIFNTQKLNYALESGQNQLTVDLSYVANGVNVIKSYTFTRGSYVIDVAYSINNATTHNLNNISAYWRLLRDDQAPASETRFAHTFTGPAYYNSTNKFNKLKFSDIAKNDVSYPANTRDGWVGYIQHYFTAMWLLDSNQYHNVCSNLVVCRFSFKAVGNNLYSAGVLTDLPTIAANSVYKINLPLYAGPEVYKQLVIAAPHLQLTKDYGWVYIFATPLFWLLVKLYELVKNWGWAIILLTFLVKLVLYPLTRASYISMAKMRALTPKLEQLKARHADDKVALQKATMELYRTEKVNPIGGCLPMILQIPIFLGLYWALLASVELRHASFLWVNDLSRPDPYYIFPVILAITMFLQTFLNPPPTDPTQAKVMRIMPVAFSIMFFFFPCGLVLYWLANNILTMLQQWYVNNHVTLRRKNRADQKVIKNKK